MIHKKLPLYFPQFLQKFQKTSYYFSLQTLFLPLLKLVVFFYKNNYFSCKSILFPTKTIEMVLGD